MQSLDSKVISATRIQTISETVNTLIMSLTHGIHNLILYSYYIWKKNRIYKNKIVIMSVLWIKVYLLRNLILNIYIFLIWITQNVFIIWLFKKKKINACKRKTICIKIGYNLYILHMKFYKRKFVPIFVYKPLYIRFARTMHKINICARICALTSKARV